MKSRKSENLSAIISTFGFLFLLLPIFYIWIPYEIITSKFMYSFTIGVFRYIGILFILAGMLIAGFCSIEFVLRGRGSPIPFSETEKLIVSGCYKFVRNPLYIAGVSCLFGEALLFQSLGILFYTLVLIFVFHIQILLEERFLEEKFGEKYKEYCKNVPRWLPQLKPDHQNGKDTV